MWLENIFNYLLSMKNRKIFYLAKVTCYLSVLNIAKFLSFWMLKTKLLYMLERLKKIARYNMRYAIFHPFIRQIWQVLHLFFCFISFLGLLGIFMAMINIVRIELIGATEYCLLNSVSARFFLPTGLFLIHPILIWSRLI